ncbi:hypothetical protein [Halorussus lipolyticus]|uniref:hypothetical protein n=1 Tax=Halorussus lipolyticus TaxID=3034024 RepID=UPI0023E88664|nr:hypothetical protein [Halorussus sp. DT80]
MSIKTPERAHDHGEARASDDERGRTTRESTRQPPANEETDDASDWRPDTDDELVVVVCPQRIYEQLQPDLDESRERLCREYEREHEDLLAERAQLADEVDALERQLARKESQLDAVITRNEQILEARTESYQNRIERRENGEDDDFEWTGSRQESGLLARLKNWLR